MEAIEILRPVFVMGLLTTLIFVWMLLTRLPAMTKAGLAAQDARDTSVLKSLPPHVAQIADNYNHLFEQPTLFYAVAIAIAVLGHVDPFHVQCAWAFTLLRIAHSLVQSTLNIVMVRFTLFLAAWVVLGIMVVREVIRSFG